MADVSDELDPYNPKSKYQEVEKIEGLTLYDMERKPFPKVGRKSDANVNFEHYLTVV
jgi:hypothetical protein